MKKKNACFKAIVIIALFTLGLNGCYYDSMEELNPGFPSDCVVPDSVSYTKDVRPILDRSCSTSSCHNQSPGSSGHSLMTYDEVKSDALQSLMDAVNHVNGARPMPEGGGKLDACSISIIQKWIDQGVKDN